MRYKTKYNPEEWREIRKERRIIAKKQARLAYRRNLSKQRRKIIDELKVSRGCTVCGEKHPACLSFHHKDYTKKKFNIASMVSNFSMDNILVEIEKCDVLCENCHRKLHWKNRDQ